jgi:pyridoxamine 5'-phosphate oxidase
MPPGQPTAEPSNDIVRERMLSASREALRVTPLETLAAWMEEARAAGVEEPEAMALATVDAGGAPSVRVVLCRGVDADGVTFFTSYESRKGRELAANPRASVVFHWHVLRRQVRVEGAVERVAAAASDAYFHSRARGSQLAASVSPQSREIESLDWLKARHRELESSLAGGEVPRPPTWGGYRLRAHAIELWTAGADRLHHRVRFERAPGGGWGGGATLAP